MMPDAADASVSLCRWWSSRRATFLRCKWWRRWWWWPSSGLEVQEFRNRSSRIRRRLLTVRRSTDLFEFRCRADFERYIDNWKKRVSSNFCYVTNKKLIFWMPQPSLHPSLISILGFFFILTMTLLKYADSPSGIWESCFDDNKQLIVGCKEMALSRVQLLTVFGPVKVVKIIGQLTNWNKDIKEVKSKGKTIYEKMLITFLFRTSWKMLLTIHFSNM